MDSHYKTPPRPRFDGDTLVIPDWKFSQKDVRVPHRSYQIATHTDGRTMFYVECNHPETLFWVHALGDGFSGAHSRASHTCATRNAEVAKRWAAAVNSGKVRIE